MSKKALIAASLLAGLAGVAYWQREPMLVWHEVRQLMRASPEEREERAQRVADREDAALPRVLDGLRCGDEAGCVNMQAALAIWTKRWGVADPRSFALVEELRGRFERFSLAGQEQTLVTLTGLLQQEGPRPLPPRLTKAVSEVLVASERHAELRLAALLLAAKLVVSGQPGQWADLCRRFAEAGLAEEREPARIAALHLLLQVPMRADVDLLAKAAPLLRDHEASVRRAAVVALASAREVVRDEALLPLLHDDDPQVQYYCELALRKRGLTDDDLKLARLISDRDAAVRMRVFHYLPRMPDLNHAEWLRQLSRDASPALRAAAVRAMGESADVDLSGRLREMADTDPSDAVRQNARYYLQQRTMRTARD